MTTLRIEVGRHCSTKIEDVVAGLVRAGCMKYVEIDPDAYAFLPIDELKSELESNLFHVELRAWPAPPPPTLLQRVRAWPRRCYLLGRRLVLRETAMQQFLDAHDYTALSELATRESPLLAAIQKGPPS